MHNYAHINNKYIVIHIDTLVFHPRNAAVAISGNAGFNSRKLESLQSRKLINMLPDTVKFTDCETEQKGQQTLRAF